MEVQETALLKMRRLKFKRGAASQKFKSKKFLIAAVTLAVKILTLVEALPNPEMRGTNLTS